MPRPRLAWFSPMPPVRSGIAGRSAELVADLRRDFDIDVFVDEAPGLRSAQVSPKPRSGGRDEVSPKPRSGEGGHDFLPRHHVQPYDLCVYQFGNSAHHDYIWPYALRYSGLVVLHETRLHHARAAALLHQGRADDYRAELAWNEPALNPDLAELAIAGFDSRLYYDWPMVRALVASARLTAVHGEGARAELLERLNAPGAKGPTAPDRITAIQLGEGIPLTPSQRASARQAVRARYGIPDEAVVFGCFGALTHDKRVPQIIEAFATIRDVADVRLLLGGEPAGPRDIAAEVSARNLNGLVTTTGYLESEAALTDHIAACDVSLNLRWPTARETSGPWVRALALGLPTITTRLRHTTDVPALDIRGARSEEREADPVTLAIDIVDEARELPVAMRLLASDAALRERLGRAAHAWWSREHTFERMASDYRGVIAAALDRPAPDVSLPAHLRDDHQGLLRELVAPFGRPVTECIRDF